MKTLGIIGGIGPGSTVDYYQTIIALYRTRKADGSYPPLLINSIDVQRVLAMVGAGQLAALTDWLLTELEKLERAGADFAIMASNTPHIVFDEVEGRSPLPLISIVTATCEIAKARGLKRLALFGTKFTMQGSVYRDVFARQEMTVVVPDSPDQDFIHEKYMSELVAGIFLPETRAGLLAIVDKLAHQAGIDGVILGGTELPLILRDPAHHGIPFLNTTRIHCESAIERMFS
ncbi:MAG: aspartate racemase [Verrucomicrobia bacterium]|nr:MAG: aspartate racemase [Verrucomicrobiota bacterium]